MKWSLKLARIAGVDVFVHVTFAILIVWIAIGAWVQEGSVEAVVRGLTFMTGLFTCVVLHELGHALAARRYGIRTRDITLLPIGGMARLEQMPEKPAQEFVVALAGPAVNLVIATLLATVLQLTGSWNPEADPNPLRGPLLQGLLLVNVVLFVFNLLPAFPMDGGRALRALLASRMEYVRATNIAAHLGQAMALLFGLLGLFGNPLLVFIALFVWIGAAAEASLVQARAALAGVPVAAAMVADFASVSSTDSLEHVADLTLAGSQKDFPVVDQGVLRGLLTQEDMLAALARGDRGTRVGSAMQTDVPTVDSHEMLEHAFVRFADAPASTLPVLHAGAFVGLLTMDNVVEFLRIRSAREGHRTSGPVAWSKLGLCVVVSSALLLVGCLVPWKTYRVAPPITGQVEGGAGDGPAELVLTLQHRENAELHSVERVALDGDGSFAFRPVELDIAGEEYSKVYRVRIALERGDAPRSLWRAEFSRRDATESITLDCALDRPVAHGQPCRVRDPLRHRWLVEAGAATFAELCSTCHGADAGGIAGTGPDLRQIAARDDGRFDRDRIAEWIEGRSTPEAHGPRTMPVWGERLSVEYERFPRVDDLVGARLDPVLAYLRSVQTDSP